MKTNIKEVDCLKIGVGGAWTVSQFKEGTCQESGGVVSEWGVDTLMHTMLHQSNGNLQILHCFSPMDSRRHKRVMVL